MSDDSDFESLPNDKIKKAKRKVLQSDSSDSSNSDSSPITRKRTIKCRNKINSSDSDSSIEKPRKKHRVYKVAESETESETETESSSSDSEIFVNNKKILGGVKKVVLSESESFSSSSSASELENNFSDFSDGQSEKCPICLLKFKGQEVGTPDCCDHIFCFECLQAWSQNVNTCPVDRQIFSLILVRKEVNGKIIRQVSVDKKVENAEVPAEDPTFCEICGSSDREDRLLLCDGCDLGYHLECLDPPLEFVPIEEWFCQLCLENDQILQQNFGNSPQRNHNNQNHNSPRLIPRTRHIERVRTQIAANRRNIQNQIQSSPDSYFNNDNEDNPPTQNCDLASNSSGFGSAGNSSRSRQRSCRSMTTTKKRKSTKKRKKRTPRTYYFDIDENTGQKIKVYRKTTRGRRKKRKTTKSKIKRRQKTVEKVPKTVKKRLATSLGICAPQKGNQSYINSKNSGLHLGIPTLHLFGQRDQLDYFSDENDPIEEENPTGGLSVMTSSSRQITDVLAARRAARRKMLVTQPPSISSIDILGSILNEQQNFHSKNAVLSVSRDGTLKIESNQKNYKETNQTERVDLNNVETSVTQAPMFPNRNRGGSYFRGGSGGNGGNQSNYRGNTSNYQGGGNSYSYNQNNQNYRSPRDFSNNSNHNVNQQQQQNYFGGPPIFNSNNYSPNFPPQNFRGRGPIRFPMRRPLYDHENDNNRSNDNFNQSNDYYDRENEMNEGDFNDNDNDNYDNDGVNVNDDNRNINEDNDNVDIYSDIEEGGPNDEPEEQEANDSEEIYKNTNSPPRNLEPAPIPDFESHSHNSSENEDLVIDDSEKYDPADPSHDTDDDKSLHNDDKSLQPLETEEKRNETNENLGPSSSGSQIRLNVTRVPTVSKELLKEAVKEVLHEHLDKKRTRSISNEGERGSDDEDCPNFSIYSAESIDIAKKTDMEIVEPQLNQQGTVTGLQDESCSIQNPNDSTKNIVANYGSDEESNSNQNENEKIENVIDQVESELEKMETDTDKDPKTENEKCQNNDGSSQNNDSSQNDMGSENIDKDSQNVNRGPQNVDRCSQDIERGSQNVDESLSAQDDMDEPAETSKVSDSQIDKDESDELIAEISHIIDEDIRKEEKDPHQIEVLQNEVLHTEGHNHSILPRTPIKVAFDPKRKSQSLDSSERQKQQQQTQTQTQKPVLSLYDDSDLEEWAPKVDTAPTELEKLTEAISEEERSYTPCLDEKEPTSTSNTTCNKGISGLDTELISDDEKNDFDFQNDNSKNYDTNEIDEIALEINAKESELDIVKPEDYEEGEIIEKAKIGNASVNVTELISKEKPYQNNDKDINEKKSQRKSSDYEHETSSRPQKLDKSTSEKSKTRDKSVDKKSEKFKKFSKKERNYRDKENRDNSHRQNRSPEKNDKSNKKSNRKERKQDLERYCVRALMADKPRKDQFGRDLSDRNHSGSRERDREKSISLSPRRSRSISFDRKKNRKNRNNKNSSRSRRSRSFSRSPRSRRSRSPRRSKSPIRNKRKSYRSASRDNNKSYNYRSISREKRYKRNGKSLERDRERDRSGGDNRNNKKSRKKSRSPSYKRFERNRSFNRDWSPSFSRTPSPRPTSKKIRESFSPSWTPPLENRPQENLTVILKNNDKSREKKRDKRKKQSKNDLFRSKKRRNNTPPPSKEVFASGDNILVSVSFNKPTNESEEIISSKKNRSSVEKKSKKNREKRRRLSPSKVSSKSSKKSKTALNIKPVAIIDLDNSPFKEITPSPKDIIILSDSDPEKSNEKNNSQQKPPPSAALSEISENLEKSPSFCQGGPKTPPEPQIKFLISKQTNSLRPIMNPLHDPSEQNENDNLENDEMEENFGNKGPNTPPEPPNSPPSSPDAYDPFEPTKSRSPTPEPENNTSSAEKQKNDTDLASQLSNTNDNLSNMDNSKDKTPENSENINENNENGQESSTQPIGVVINQQVQQANVFPTVKPLSNMATSGSQSNQIITSTPTMANNTSLPRANLFNTPSLGNTSRIIVLPTTSKNSPAKASPAKLPIKSTPIKPMQSSKTMISKLPVPNVKPVTPLNRKNSKSQSSFEKSNDVIEVGSDFDSPYSPGSSDYEDLFEPPTEISQNKSSKKTQNSKSPAKNASTFDNLFAASPVYRKNTSSGNKKSSSGSKNKKKGTPQKHNKSHVGVKIDEENLKILDELPNSAVQLAVKDKFLKKLNRQERVVEEVKHVLKPHYNKKHITKEQYKDILRRSVPKICHNKSGEINPKKIQNLIEAYVKRARHQNKTSNNSAPQIQQTTQATTKPAKTTFWS